MSTPAANYTMSFGSWWSQTPHLGLTISYVKPAQPSISYGTNQVCDWINLPPLLLLMFRLVMMESSTLCQMHMWCTAHIYSFSKHFCLKFYEMLPTALSPRLFMHPLKFLTLKRATAMWILPNTKLPRNKELSLIVAPPLGDFFSLFFTLDFHYFSSFTL